MRCVDACTAIDLAVISIDRLFRAQRHDGRATRQLVALHQFAIWHRLFTEGDGGRPDVCDPIAFIS
jgi:hypothetical protein